MLLDALYQKFLHFTLTHFLLEPLWEFTHLICSTEILAKIKEEAIWGCRVAVDNKHLLDEAEINIQKYNARRKHNDFDVGRGLVQISVLFSPSIWLLNNYLIPFKIRASLIFAHLDCAKIKESKVAQYESAKIKGARKQCHERMKNGKFTVK